MLKLSSLAARELHACGYAYEVKVNWLAGQSPESFREQISTFRKSQGKAKVAGKGRVDLPHRLWLGLVEKAGIREDQKWADLSSAQMEALVEAVTASRFQAKGKTTFKEEFVTAGGVNLDEVDFRKFESRLHPGLFMAGEMLNIDAVTGGFNFQAAWTGGWHVAQEILRRKNAQS